MNDFWDDLIERKYSNRSKFFDLHISDLTKFKSGNYNQYFGYEYNSDYMVNVCFYSENSEVFNFHLEPEDYFEIEEITKKSKNLLKVIGDCGDEYRKNW